MNKNIPTKFNSHPPAYTFPLDIAFCCLQNLKAPIKATTIATKWQATDNGTPTSWNERRLTLPAGRCRRNNCATSTPCIAITVDVRIYARNVLSRASNPSVESSSKNNIKHTEVVTIGLLRHSDTNMSRPEPTDPTPNTIASLEFALGVGTGRGSPHSAMIFVAG
jgi:hypothetical protein